MALSDEVIARYSAQRLAEVTNPDSPAAAVVDAGRLAKACDDAIGDFQRLVGVAFNLAVASHIGPAVDRAYACLLKRMDPAGAFTAEMLRETEQTLASMRTTVGDGVRPTPYTNSVLTPSVPDTSSGDPIRPDYDPTHYSDIIPGGTGSASVPEE